MKFCRLFIFLFALITGSANCSKVNEKSTIFFGEYTPNFVTRWGFQNICQHVFDQRIKWPTQAGGVTFDPAHVKKGDLIFVRDFWTFYNTIYPAIMNPFILISSGEHYDRMHAKYIDLLKNDTKIIAWFGIHPIQRSDPKFYPIPLGILQMKEYYENRIELSHLFAQLRKLPKEELLYLNFSVRTRRPYTPEREEAAKFFEQTSFGPMVSVKPFMDYIKEMARFKFTLAPKGVSPDTYRVWEAMLVGCIPIVKTSQMNELYKDLPILIVKNWDEVTPEFLEIKYKEMVQKKYAIEKLFMEYWIAKVESVRQAFLSNENKA